MFIKKIVLITGIKIKGDIMKTYDIVVVGASIGGVIAAISAAKEGHYVSLIEKTKWIGGQLTSQAVPPDEHKFIESFGSTQTYRAFRNRVRSYIKEHHPVLKHIHDVNNWDPGRSSVSRLAAPPKVILDVLYEFINPYIQSGHIELFLNQELMDAVVDDDTVLSIDVKDIHTNHIQTFSGTYFLDATDLGELLPLTHTEYVTGAESKADTGELNALEVAEPNDMQPITWVAAVDYVEGEDHTIEKPELYDFFEKKIWPCDDQKMLSWYGPDSSTGKTKKFGMFNDEGKKLFPLWSYRRIIYPPYYEKGFYDTEVTLLNWPQNDYIFGNIFDNDDAKKHQYQAKQLTLSFIYWLQRFAPRSDGGIGYKGVRLRPDIVGTEDGLAMAPYIRESRRIKALYRITENEINANVQKSLPRHEDSVGIGSYHIDLHMTTVTHTFFYANSWPFEIPLGAMIPIRMKNLIPACKNIGTTHLTNGCFRLHPVEWNIGEVAGYLVSKAISWNKTPKEIYEDKRELKKFQTHLDDVGIERSWPADKVHVI
jgi:hypothetical protein